MSDAGFTSLVIILCLFDVFPVSDQSSPGYGMYLFIFDFSVLGILSPSIVIIYNMFCIQLISFVGLCYVRVILET